MKPSLLGWVFVAVAVAWLSYAFGHGTLVAPLAAERDRLKKDLDQVKGHKNEVGELNSRVLAVERRLEESGARLKQVFSHLLKDANDLLRMAESRDQVLKDLRNLQFVPSGPRAVPRPFSVDMVEDLNRQLVERRNAFLKIHPKLALDRWTVPSEISVVRIEDSFRLDGSYDDDVAFLSRIQACPLFLEVSALKVEGFNVDGEKRLSATLSVSTLTFPGEEEGEEGAVPAPNEPSHLRPQLPLVQPDMVPRGAVPGDR
jgi:hypothetical protein